MARPRKTEAPDLAKVHDLTVGAIDRLACPVDKDQAFLRDAKAPGLRVRVTAAGAKAFVFEAKLHRRTVRRTIGDVRDWSIDAARAEARRLSVLIDGGVDPRELDRQQEAERKARAAKEAADATTVREAWQAYLDDRKPFWGALNYRDHVRMAQTGGEPRKRWAGAKTQPGPLAGFMPMRLVDLTQDVVETWSKREAIARPASVRLSLRLLKAFLRWCDEQPHLKGRVQVAAASSKKARESAGKPRTKNDCLQREQLASWFEQVRAIPNPVVSAYLQCLLLSGRRREHVMGWRREDVDFRWRTITMEDKVEDGKVKVPLTPYVAHLLTGLPKVNEWVFASTRGLSMEEKNRRRRQRRQTMQGRAASGSHLAVVSASGRLMNPERAHQQACEAAGIQGLTLHGLRRSFASLAEWLDVPAGVVAQIQGHKPSGVREKHYVRRPIDLLRLHHEKIERWILNQAGIDFGSGDERSPICMAA